MDWPQVLNSGEDAFDKVSVFHRYFTQMFSQMFYTEAKTIFSSFQMLYTFERWTLLFSFSIFSNIPSCFVTQQVHYQLSDVWTFWDLIFSRHGWTSWAIAGELVTVSPSRSSQYLVHFQLQLMCLVSGYLEIVRMLDKLCFWFTLNCTYFLLWWNLT